MTAQVFGLWPGYPANGDSIATVSDDERADGQLWVRLGESHPVDLVAEVEPDYDLMRKQQIESRLAEDEGM